MPNMHTSAVKATSLCPTTHAPQVVMQVRHVVYAYKQHAPLATSEDKGDPGIVPVINGFDLTLHGGEKVALVGPSGTGKSTILHLLGLLDFPQSGEIWIRAGGALVETSTLGQTDRTALRAHSLGFVYQFHHLLPEFTALENVMIPQLIAGAEWVEAKIRAQSLLECVGLENRTHHKPSQLSGGQQQRTAIARALANRPTILLADEPTGNLDEATATEIFQLFVDLAKHEHMAMLVATHNPGLLPFCDRVVTLRDGKGYAEDDALTPQSTPPAKQNAENTTISA